MGKLFTVAVTGAAGFVGRHIVRELLDQGHAVRALAFDPEKTRKYLPTNPRLAILQGDILAPGIADQLLAGATACINLIGILRERRGLPTRPLTFEREHVEVPKLLAARCQALGVSRFIHMSALGAGPTAPGPYGITKYEGELAIRLSKLDWTIFRPSIIHGGDGGFIELAKGWATGKEAPYKFMPFFTREEPVEGAPLGIVRNINPLVAPVSVNDVARAFVAALNNPNAIQEIYNLVGSETLSWPDMLTYIRDGIGAGSNPAFGIPGEPAALVATAAGFVGLADKLPFDPGMARMGSQDSTASLDKFTADFGFTPAPFRASFDTYAQDLVPAEH